MYFFKPMMVDIEPEWNWASVDYFWKLHYNFLLKCKYLHVKNYIHLYKVHLLIYKINIYSILRFTYILTLYIIYLPVCVLSSFSLVWLFTTLWTVARQSPLSMGFSRQECWSGLPCSAEQPDRKEAQGKLWRKGCRASILLEHNILPYVPLPLLFF